MKTPPGQPWIASNPPSLRSLALRGLLLLLYFLAVLGSVVYAALSASWWPLLAGIGLSWAASKRNYLVQAAARRGWL